MKEKGGIYRFVNSIDRKMYIGSAKNFKIRQKQHLKALRTETHYNKHFQNAWNKYKEINFVFEILEHVEDESNLIAREQYWIDKLKPEYNLFLTAGSPLGYKHTDEAKEKLSLAAKNKTESHRLAISKAHKGKVTSVETKLKMSIASKGKPKSEEHRAKIKLVKQNISQETRERMSEAQFRRQARER